MCIRDRFSALNKRDTKNTVCLFVTFLLLIIAFLIHKIKINPFFYLFLYYAVLLRFRCLFLKSGCILRNDL